MKIFSFSCPRPVRSAPSGDGVLSVFSETIRSDGTKGLAVTSKTNVYEKIQASVPACNVNNIVRRFEMGDISVVNRTQGFYGDLTSAPKNIIEAQKTILNFEKQFAELPAEVRSEFGNNPFIFMENYEAFVKKYSKPNKKVVSQVEDFKKEGTVNE